MKICHYGSNQAGAISGDRIVPIGDALVKAGHMRAGYTMLDIVDALANNPAAMKCAQDAQRGPSELPLASAKLHAPITNPPSLWCAAANYRSHQMEMQARGLQDRSKFSADELMAEIFLKPTSAIIGPGGPVILPKIAKHVDFECELCAVIGKEAKNVSREQALDYVFGYTICWDFSMRDPWGGGHQNTRNIRKGFDTFAGIGPWIVTRDEISEPQDLSINVEQNGKPVMTAHTGDMINGLRDIISFLSRVATLQPGVLITTGTPAGVSRLAHGDRLKGTISKIGTMEVAVEAEQ